jgi:hypothetical protein
MSAKLSHRQMSADRQAPTSLPPPSHGHVLNAGRRQLLLIKHEPDGSQVRPGPGVKLMDGMLLPLPCMYRTYSTAAFGCEGMGLTVGAGGI